MNQQDELLSIIVDIGPEATVIDYLLYKERDLTGRLFAIDFYQVLDDYLGRLRVTEVNRHYNQIYTHTPLWKDNRLLEEVVSTLECKLRNEAVITESLIQPICQSMYQCLNQLSLSIHEVMMNYPINRILHYNFRVGERLGASQFILREKPIGDDDAEVSFNPWVQRV